jgi:factor associated with neutral sphingomyelinase activation
MFQNIGIELWFYNYPYSVLLVFSDHTNRELVYRHLKEKGEKLITIDISDLTHSWTNGEISNIHYLNKINILANRSFNDLSQYPIFPWVLHSYDLDFDLRNHELFRDLSKPIGAINKHRLRKLKDLYELQLKDKTLSNPAHLYPTHYSTPGFVSYYLIRKIP